MRSHRAQAAEGGGRSGVPTDPGTHARLGAECLAWAPSGVAGLDPWDIGVNRSSGAVVAAATVHRTGRKCTPRSNDLYLPCFKPWFFGTP